MALDRMARGREGADEVLVLDPAGRHLVRRVGRSHQAALAHRTGLPGPQAGGRARTLRGARMARLPPSRPPLHRSLRISDLRAGDDSPLVWGFPCQGLGVDADVMSVSTFRYWLPGH